MNIMHLKSKVRGSTHGTLLDRLQIARPKSTMPKLTEATPSVAETQALLARGGGGKMVLVPTLHNKLIVEKT